MKNKKTFWCPWIWDGKKWVLMEHMEVEASGINEARVLMKQKYPDLLNIDKVRLIPEIVEGAEE